MHQLFHKFTSHLKEALLKAYHVAKKEQRVTIAPRHLLISLASQHGSLAAELLHKRGIREEVLLDTTQLTDIDPMRIDLSDEAREVVQKMVGIAFEYQHHYVGTEHLLAALLELPIDTVSQYLRQKNVSKDALVKEVEQVLSSTTHFTDMTDLFDDDAVQFAPEQVAVGQSKRSKQRMLDTFAQELTASDIQKNIDPVIGRHEEIDRLIHVLSRRTKNNPLLLGEPGVGKTAIVEGLAKRIVNEDVPPVLLGKKIVTLDLSLMVAGTMYRGEFESRLKQVLDELQKDTDTIVFIDEIHTIVGAGSSTGGTLDAANIIKPALARGQMRCIGATTLEEYRKTIEADPALSRRFQPIMIREQSAKESSKVLKGIKKYYEQYHGVTIPDETISAAVDLSVRYIHDRHLPDKAIDLLDEAAAKAKISHTREHDVTHIQKLKKQIIELEQKKEDLVMKEQFDEAWELKKQQKHLEKKLAKLRLGERNKQSQNIVTPQMIGEVVARVTGVPLLHITAAQTQRFGSLDTTLKKRIVGQDHAIDTIARTLKRAHIGLSKPHRPLGTYMFMGPSGVGKTALAKALAEEVFQSSDALIRVDMSEFSEGFTVSKLLGAPAGYVGYKESGMLTERVRRRPYSVVLFDEIEKAHPDIFNVLLQILDEGSITDASGMRVDFTNTIIIMTSNIGAEQFNVHAHMGFDEQDEHDMYTKFEQLKASTLKDIEKQFKPEFINRIDNIIAFNPLTSKDLVKIVELELKDLQKRLKRHNVKLKVHMPAKRFIAEESFAPHKGAREITRRVEERIEHPLIQKIIEQSIGTGDTIKVTHKDKELLLEKA